MSAQLYVLPTPSLADLSMDALMAEAERMRDCITELTDEMRSRLTTPERPERHLRLVEGTHSAGTPAEGTAICRTPGGVQ